MGSDQDAILKLLRDQEAAIARGDAEGVIAPLADDIAMFDLPPPLVYRGTGARHIDGLNGWFASWDGGVTTELHDPEVQVSGDLAVVFGLSRMRGNKKGEGPLDAWNRRTVVLARRNGAWHIVHEHSSYPMKMDGSGGAATDLKP